MTEGNYKVYEDDAVVIWHKKSGTPTVPLKSSEKDEETLLYVASRENPEILTGFGRNHWEGGAIHRLDTATEGLVMFSRTAEAYESLVESQSSGRIVKRYRALTDSPGRILPGFPDFRPEGNRIVSSFRTYGPGGAAVRPVEGNMYMTRIISRDGELYTVEITKGFRHQIRAHLSWIGHPIVGDCLYGGKESDKFFLEAFRISYPDPITGEVRVIQI